MLYVLSYDLGTTGVKSCLIQIGEKVKLLGGEYKTYGLRILENGGAEQDPDEWWEALKETTKRLFEKTDIKPEEIAGISFCSQMQGLVLVDKNGRALRPAMSYMDQRAGDEMKETEQHGLCVAGVNAIMLIKSLRATHAASTSVKDPLWKYKWVQKNEPDIYKRIYKWLDVKEYMICRLTGKCVMTYDSAYSTFLYDTRNGKRGWSKSLCKMYGVDINHLPRLIGCSDVAGVVTKEAAAELGIKAGTKVYGSGGDATLIGVGAGSTSIGDTHIYWGTSGWVGTVIDKQVVDINAMIAGIIGAETDKYNYFAEMETAGKCFEWVKDHLITSEVDDYYKEFYPEISNKEEIEETQETRYTSLYDFMSEAIEKVEPGCGGMLFTPWLHGNRCPFEDPYAAGMFFNIGIESRRREMIRAVIEGICYHLRWMLECQDKKIKTSQTIRFVGGGAVSKVTCQILADITGRSVETVKFSKDVGALGAAMLVAVGSGEFADLAEMKSSVEVEAKYEPDERLKGIYDKNYRVFKELYKANKKLFAKLNKPQQA